MNHLVIYWSLQLVRMMVDMKTWSAQRRYDVTYGVDDNNDYSGF